MAQLRCMLCCFGALLPPRDGAEEQHDYYEILGVERDASLEDMRRAYKKRSLQCHPDKKMQRGDAPYSSNVDTAAKQQDDFQLLREAYETLSNPRKQEIYDILGPSAMPYVTNPSSIGPTELMKNLTQASYWDRTKLFLFVLLVFSILLLQPILICLNIDMSTNTDSFLTNPKWPWIYILIPLWALDGLVYLGFIFNISRLLRKARKHKAKEEEHQSGKKKKKNRYSDEPDDGDVVGEIYTMLRHSLLMLFRFVLINLTQVFIALKLDNTLQWSYYIIFIPLYIHELTQLIISSISLHRAQKDIGKMITIQILERHILKKNETYADLSQTRKNYINEKYIIVHVPASQQSASGDEEGSETDDDYKGVERSPEYEIANLISEQAWKRIVLFFFHAAFLVMIVLKLDTANATDWSWWLVFLPIWILACCSCCGTCYKVSNSILSQTTLVAVKKEDTDGEEDEGDHATEEDLEAALAKKNQQKDVEDAKDLVEEAKESTKDTQQDLEAGAKSKEKTSVQNSTETKKENDVLNASSASSTSKIKKQAETNQSEVDEDDDDDDDEISYHEEEDYYYFAQNNDANTSEQMAKASSQCCNVMWYITVACLFVGKLQGGDYSSFWIIFPVLLPAGMLVCCLCCGIYCATALPDKNDAGEDIEVIDIESGSAAPNKLPTEKSDMKKDSNGHDEKAKEEKKEEETEKSPSFDPDAYGDELD